MKILIQNGRVLNPASNTDALLDILIEEQTIAQIGPSLSDQDVDQTIDATDCYVMPGLIDLHVHLRDPGQTYKETLETGGKAAAKGGFTTIVAMANTTPVIDDPQKVMEVHDRSKFSSPIQILQVASVTKGM
ncbi:amidohydrolase family protein, partial [Lachnospiraceae bacterium OttesenSCG-928-E19]|nr:amidohydrolase family protein [Lachnospiraceae bacterium OttesenSCG-928-E19]